MKKLIATAVIALAASSAHAFDSRFDAYEYHAGSALAPAVTTASVIIDETLYQEGTFPDVRRDNISGPELGDAREPLDENLYLNGNFPS